MTSIDATAGLELKLTYNRQRGLPRNFFIHLYNVPLDATVCVKYNDYEFPTTNSNGYVDVRFSIMPDNPVEITIVREDEILGSGQYLVHDEDVYEHVFNTKCIPIVQWTYMRGK